MVAEGIKRRNVPLEIVDVINSFPGQAHRWLGGAEGIKPQHRLKWVALQGAESKLSVIQLDYAPCLDRHQAGDYSA